MKEGERKELSCGAQPEAFMNATEGKTLGKGGQEKNARLGGLAWIFWVLELGPS